MSPPVQRVMSLHRLTELPLGAMQCVSFALCWWSSDEQFRRFHSTKMRDYRAGTKTSRCQLDTAGCWLCSALLSACVHGAKCGRTRAARAKPRPRPGKVKGEEIPRAPVPARGPRAEHKARLLTQPLSRHRWHPEPSIGVLYRAYSSPILCVLTCRPSAGTGGLAVLQSCHLAKDAAMAEGAEVLEDGCFPEKRKVWHQLLLPRSAKLKRRRVTCGSPVACVCTRASQRRGNGGTRGSDPLVLLFPNACSSVSSILSPFRLSDRPSHRARYAFSWVA